MRHIENCHSHRRFYFDLEINSVYFHHLIFNWSNEFFSGFQLWSSFLVSFFFGRLLPHRIWCHANGDKEKIAIDFGVSIFSSILNFSLPPFSLLLVCRFRQHLINDWRLRFIFVFLFFGINFHHCAVFSFKWIANFELITSIWKAPSTIIKDHNTILRSHCTTPFHID